MFQKPVSIIMCKRGRAPTEGMRLTLSDGHKVEILPLLHLTMERDPVSKLLHLKNLKTMDSLSNFTAK
jgi:hypothetical protein